MIVSRPPPFIERRRKRRDVQQGGRVPLLHGARGLPEAEDGDERRACFHASVSFGVTSTPPSPSAYVSFGLRAHTRTRARAVRCLSPSSQVEEFLLLKEGDEKWPEAIATLRSIFLRVVRAEYWDQIEKGHLPGDSYAAQILLHSTEEAQDKCHECLADWYRVNKNNQHTDDNWLEKLLDWMDKVLPEARGCSVGTTRASLRPLGLGRTTAVCSRAFGRVRSEIVRISEGDRAAVPVTTALRACSYASAGRLDRQLHQRRRVLLARGECFLRDHRLHLSPQGRAG